nr:LysM peptidoglycan-binding domain-containing protein [Parabacteroides goldsteinii]
MNKISIYVLTLCLSFACISLHSQNNRARIITNNELNDNIFYHTIERGQTVYSIATMYGVTVDDIYRLNPESRESIKAGATLKIPQRDAGSASLEKTEENFLYHTIQPKETLYSLSIRYAVPGPDIIEANPGLSTSTFTIGKTIRIPATPIESLPTKEVKTVTKEIEYTIEKKETMYRICRKFNISSAELIKRNPKLKDGVKAGMVIKIPVEAKDVVTETAPVMHERDVNALLTAPKEIKRVNMIKVALLLPFMTNEKTPSANTLRFIEYYEGMLLAVDSLRNSGGSIELSVFDTGSGTKKLKEVLKDDALKEANLIIGAVYNDQIGPVAEFAEKNNIKYVIPFTSKNDDVLSNANIFQVNTPHSYLYAKASQAGCDLFANDNVILLKVPGTEEKTDFIKAFKAEMKQRNIPWRELTYSAETFPTEMEALLSKEKRSVIVPTSGTLEALNNFKSPLRMLSETKPEYNITMFGYPEWQTYTRECLDDFFALNTYIYSNFYADNLAPEVSDFYSKYKTWYSKSLINYFPKYGILGFDTGMFFFDAIRKYGSNFENNLGNIRYKGIQTCFDFERVNNWGGFINTNIFIVHYQNDYNVTRSEVR